MNSLAKVWLAFSLMISREDLKGIVQTGLIVGACGLGIAALLARQSSPIIGLEQDTGTVVNFVGVTPDTPGTAAGGDRYLYGIRLGQNGALVFVYGNANEPLAVGAQVTVERQHRKNGVETYRLLSG